MSDLLLLFWEYNLQSEGKLLMFPFFVGIITLMFISGAIQHHQRIKHAEYMAKKGDPLPPQYPTQRWKL